MLLLGSVIIGVITGPTTGADLAPFMNGLFKGMVLLFLLDVGMMAARQVDHLHKVGLPKALFGIFAPLINGTVGIGVGDALLFTLLCASSS